jgi:hypothetical protein
MGILRVALVLVFSGPLLLCHSHTVAQRATEGAVSADVLNQEKLAWELTKKKDKAGLAKLLSEDFTEITEDGVFDKSQILANLGILTLTSDSPRDFRAKLIAPDFVLLIYQVTVNGKYKDRTFRADNNAASLWMKHGSKWQNIFFQETPIPKSNE